MALATAAGTGVIVVGYLLVKAAGLTRETWSEVGVVDFLFGRVWEPAAGQFGALPAISGTVATSFVAMALAVPLAIGVAIATSILLPPKLRGIAAGLIDLLAAIPSVVYGLWGFLVLVPTVKPVLEWIERNNPGLPLLGGPVLGGSVLLAGLVLAVMVLPIITAIVREVIATVPMEQREAALALGATRWEMIRTAVLPAARSGIVGASALGLGRAVGETIAVLMIIGSDPRVVHSLLGPGQSLAGTIVSQYNSAVSTLHTSAMVAMAVLLFVIAFVINLAARALVSRSADERRGPRQRLRRAATPVRVGLVSTSEWLLAGRWHPPRRPRRRDGGLPATGGWRRLRSRFAEALVYGSLIVALVPLALVLGYCVVKGIAAISWDFLTGEGEPDLVGNGIMHAMVGTTILVATATVVAVPLAVLTALFLREAAASRQQLLRKVGAWLGGLIDMLLGVPSIVAGLLIAIAVVLPMGRFSALAGGLALALIMYPIVVRSTDEMLRLVPQGQIEAALALGAPRWRVAWSVSLPTARPGIITGVMIAVARVAGETAPLVLTALSAQFVSASLVQPIASLPQYIFTGTINSTVPVAQEHSWGAALVLVTMVLLVNLAARRLARGSR